MQPQVVAGCRLKNFSKCTLFSCHMHLWKSLWNLQDMLDGRKFALQRLKYEIKYIICWFLLLNLYSILFEFTHIQSYNICSCIYLYIISMSWGTLHFGSTLQVPHAMMFSSAKKGVHQRIPKQFTVECQRGMGHRNSWK